jgi:hypothetical protein
MLAAVPSVVHRTFGGLRLYLAQMVWPDFRSFGNIKRRSSTSAGRSAARALSGDGGHPDRPNVGRSGRAGGVSRLLFGMARRLAAHRPFPTSTRAGSPSYNITVGVLAGAGALGLNTSARRS